MKKNVCYKKRVWYNFNFFLNYGCVKNTDGLFIKVLFGFMSKRWRFR